MGNFFLINKIFMFLYSDFIIRKKNFFVSANDKFQKILRLMRSHLLDSAKTFTEFYIALLRK